MPPAALQLLLRIILKNSVYLLFFILLIIFLVKGIKYFNKKNKE